MAEEEDQDQCRVDFVAVIYGIRNGEDPIEIKGSELDFGQLAEAVVKEAINEIIGKKASGLLDMVGNLSTAKLSHHVNIIYAYRFIHKGKPTNKWQIRTKNKLLSNYGVDYFLYMKDSQSKANEEVRKINEDLEKQLKEQCDEHEES